MAVSLMPMVRMVFRTLVIGLRAVRVNCKLATYITMLWRWRRDLFCSVFGTYSFKGLYPHDWSSYPFFNYISALVGMLILVHDPWG